MQQICSSMQQQWFFGVSWKIMVLFCNKVSQKKIFSPYKAIFNEKNNTLPFGPVCSKYAAVCSNRDFFPMSTPSRCIQHTKVALFPNFGALSIKITSGYILGTHSLDYISKCLILQGFVYLYILGCNNFYIQLQQM